MKLLYFEEYERIEKAFYREKQVLNWGRKKKEALINSQYDDLHKLAECQNLSHFLLRVLKEEKEVSTQEKEEE